MGAMSEATEFCDRLDRFLAQRVGDADQPDRLPVAKDDDGGLAALPETVEAGGHRRGESFVDQAGIPDRHHRAVDPAACAETGEGLEVRERARHEAALVRGADDCPGERMLGSLLQRGRQREEIVLAARERNHGGHLRASFGQRAGLVEGHRPDRRRLLEMRASLDEHPRGRRAAERRHDRHGRGDHERARAGEDQQRERAVERRRERAAEQRRHEGDHNRETNDRRGVPARKGVDPPLGRRLASLRLRDQLPDAVERGVARRRRRLNEEKALSVERAGVHVIARELVDRCRLAGNRRLIDGGRTLAQDAVDRDALARTHHHEIAEDDLCDGDLDLLHQRERPFAVSPPHSCDVGGERDEPGQLPPSSVDGPSLEPLPDREEHDDERRLQPCADRRGADGRDRHQQVDVGTARGEQRRHTRARQRKTTDEDRCGVQGYGRERGRQIYDERGREQRRRDERRPFPRRPRPQAGASRRSFDAIAEPADEPRDAIEVDDARLVFDSHRFRGEADGDVRHATEARDRPFDRLRAVGTVHPLHTADPVRIRALEIEAQPARGVIEAIERAEIRVVADAHRIPPGHRLDADHSAVVGKAHAQPVGARCAVVRLGERKLDDGRRRHQITIGSWGAVPAGSTCRVTCSIPTSSSSTAVARSSTRAESSPGASSRCPVATRRPEVRVHTCRS